MILLGISPDGSWQGLVDDRPIVSGCHPLHYYHGLLGARSFFRQGTLCAYDPAFQAGYPKTPVFDSGSRPAELFLVLAGGADWPGAYKLGLAGCGCLVPLLLWVAARGAGLKSGPACLAAALGLLVWWGEPGRHLVEAGDLDLLLGGLCAGAHLGLLTAFHRFPSPAKWLALAAVGAAGWFFHPFLFLLLIPLFLVYYLSAGPRHGLPWHLALHLGLAVGPATNSFWLGDWVRSWWLRLPLELDTKESLAHRTLHAFWESSLWGEPADRALAAALLGLAVIGVGLWNQHHQRVAARLFGLAAGSWFGLAVVGLGWPPLGRLGTGQLWLPTLWSAIPPAVYALVCLGRWSVERTRSAWRGGMLLAAMITGMAIWEHHYVTELVQRCTAPLSLEVGFSSDQQKMIDFLREQTTPQARILWEEGPTAPASSSWTALLPLRTGRAFLGGLGSELCIEHAYPRLCYHALAGRPISQWTDTELEDFFRTYNVAWVVCWSGEVAARLRACKALKSERPLPTSDGGWLFRFPAHSFFLQGRGQWLEADCRRIALGDVEPEDGVVVLSLHHQAGLRASPGRVQVEREPDPHDPIPLVRLRVPGRVARITLTWQER
jgi:hypothetical protein